MLMGQGVAADMQKNLILNVDDNEGARYSKTRVLVQAGFRVEEAANGKDALSMIDRLRPTLVLLDVKLPDISGLDVCREIRQRSDARDIRVVQISAALVSPEDRERGLQSGADKYITVPFEPHDLVAQVRTLLSPT